MEEGLLRTQLLNKRQNACVDVRLFFHRENYLIEIITKSTVCRLAFIMQPFSLHLMQRQTTGTTTDDTSTTKMPM